MDYRYFDSKEFVNRSKEISTIMESIQSRKKGVCIVEGDRGAGKTSLLIRLFQLALDVSGVSPFIVSLFPYQAPEIQNQENVWIYAKKFEGNDLPDLMQNLVSYLQIQTVESKDPIIQTEYLARGLAHRADTSTLVFFIDAIYECEDDLRQEIESYILAPLLESEQVFIVMSGRGKRPVWSRPELRNPTIISLGPLQEEFVKEQLEIIDSPHKDKYQKILKLSNGYPLIVKMLGSEKKAPEETLGEAIDRILKDTLPSTVDYRETRVCLEKLSLISKPFRPIEIQDYLFKDNANNTKKIDDLVKLLLASFIIQYKDNGFTLNESIIYPLRQWLLLSQNKDRYHSYKKELETAMQALSRSYPAAKRRYIELMNISLDLQDEKGG